MYTIFKICSGVFLAFILMSTFTIAKASKLQFKVNDSYSTSSTSYFQVLSITPSIKSLRANPWNIDKIDAQHNTIELIPDPVGSPSWRFVILRVFNKEKVDGMVVQYEFKYMASTKGNICTLVIDRAASTFDITYPSTLQPCDPNSIMNIIINPQASLTK
ncbi:hypothetical protein BH10PSE19_BH10PSE19_07460 [soil metagenome]